MGNHEDRFKELLLDKFDIPVGKYFTLSDDDKQHLVDIVMSYYERNLNTEPKLIHLYVNILNDQKKVAEEFEEFERCDIITRTIDSLEKKFGKYKKRY